MNNLGEFIKLLNFPFVLVNEIESDFACYVNWLKININNEYDSSGNKIWRKEPSGNVTENKTEFYSDVQLKQYGDMIIPFFNK